MNDLFVGDREMMKNDFIITDKNPNKWVI